MALVYHFLPPEGDARQVDVVFLDGITPIHRRPVNAAFPDGIYSEVLTEDTVASVGQGVLSKLASGAITPMTEESYTPEEAADWSSAAAIRATARAARLSPPEA